MKTAYGLSDTDLPLITRAKSGQTAAFEAIFEPCRDQLFRQAMRKLRDVDDARDAVQETAIRAWRGLHTFRSEQPVQPWLQRICRNVCIDYLRARRGDAMELGEREEQLRDTRLDLEGDVERAEVCHSIRQAIGRLPQSYRKVVRMRHLEDMEVLEIAHALRKPEGTIKSWLFRARELLRQELEPSGLAAGVR